MKIAIVGIRCSKVCIPYRGGTEKFLYELSKSLSRASYEVHLYAKKGSYVPGVHIHSIDSEDYNVLHKNDTINNRNDLIYYKEIFHHIFESEYDIVIDNSFGDSFLHFAPFLHIPTIKIHHIPPFNEIIEAIEFEKVHHNTIHHIFVSKFLKQAYNNPPNSIIIHNGVDPDVWYPSTSTEEYLVWFGRITEKKGLHFAIEAALHIDKKLIIAGEIFDREYFKNKIYPYLGKNIIYKSNLTPYELHKLVSKAECFLFTSTWDEPFGYVLAESLMAGVPVAGFKKGAASEIINEEVGSLTNNISSEGLEAAIKKALTKDRNTCAKYAKKHFSIEIMIDKYITAIETHLQSNKKYKFQKGTLSLVGESSKLTLQTIHST